MTTPFTMADNTHKAGNWFLDQLDIFQAANSDHASVKANFIIRAVEFESIIGSMLSKKSNDPIQHELILGRRGSGKSTLLKRLEIEILENPQLKSRYIPINLAEEQAVIYRLFDLWEQVLNELHFIFGKEQALKEYHSFKSENDFTRYLYHEIHHLCLKHKKQVILLLDNIDRIFENFSDDGNLLRETLINYNDVQIIGGSTRMDEHFWSYDKPFYDFFRIHRLEGLSTIEIKKLLTHWSKLLAIPELEAFVVNNPGKIESIRILTDGLPRTLQFFIQMVLQKTELKSYDYLKKIMDKVSPLFQERLNSLTAPLRKLTAEMAFVWEAASTKQLAENARMQSKIVSAHLNVLIQKGIVEKIDTGTKNHLYRLSERFFNLWFIITQGNPAQKRKAKWLSIFLENFYDKEEFRDLYAKHLFLLKDSNATYEETITFSKALAQSRYLSTSHRDEIIEHTEKLRRSAKDDFIVLPKKYKEIEKEIYDYIEKEDYSEALRLVEEIENEDDGVKFFIKGYIFQKKGNLVESGSNYLKAIEKGDVDAMFNLGNLYKKQEKFELAEEYYLKAIEKGDVDALYNLGILYRNQEKFDLAEEYYLKAIEKGDLEALYNLGILYYEQEKFDLAEEYYLKAIENGHVAALNNLGNLYSDQGKLKLAEEYFLKAVGNEFVIAFFNLGYFYSDQGKFELAEEYYLKAIEKGEFDALNNLGNLYSDLGKIDLAEEYYLKAIEKEDVDALYNLGNLYRNQEKFELAEEYYLKAIEKGNGEASRNLAILYYFKNVNKAKSLELISEQDDFIAKIPIELWNGVFNNLSERLAAAFDSGSEYLEDVIEQALIHQQTHLILEFFNSPEHGKLRQERYMVWYYITLLLSNPAQNNIELRIPPELNSTIEQILARIKDREVFYGYKQ